MERLPLRTQSIRAGRYQRQRFVLLPAFPTRTGHVNVRADDRWPVRVTVGPAHHQFDVCRQKDDGRPPQLARRHQS